MGQVRKLSQSRKDHIMGNNSREGGCRSFLKKLPRSKRVILLGINLICGAESWPVQEDASGFVFPEMKNWTKATLQQFLETLHVQLGRRHHSEPLDDLLR